MTTEINHRPADGGARLTAAVVIAALIVTLLTLAGCSGDPRTWFHRDPPTAAAEPDAQRDARLGFTAEADAGCEAIERGYVSPAMVPEVATGAGAFVRATAGKARLPAPTWTVDRLSGDPVAYRKAGESAERTAKGTQLWFWMKVAGGIALPVVLAFAKGIPGLGGILGGFAELAWAAYAPQKTKQAEEAQGVLASHTTNVLKMVQAVVPPNDLRSAISHLPPEVVEAAKVHGIDLTAPATGTT